MATPTVADYLKYANLQMAAEALYNSDATRGIPLIPGDTYTGAIRPNDLTTSNEHASKFTSTESTFPRKCTQGVYGR